MISTYCANTFTIHQFSKLDLKFGEFKVGQIFKSHIVIDKDDFLDISKCGYTRTIPRVSSHIHQHTSLHLQHGFFTSSPA